MGWGDALLLALGLNPPPPLFAVRMQWEKQRTRLHLELSAAQEAVQASQKDQELGCAHLQACEAARQQLQAQHDTLAAELPAYVLAHHLLHAAPA